MHHLSLLFRHRQGETIVYFRHDLNFATAVCFRVKMNTAEVTDTVLAEQAGCFVRVLLQEYFNCLLKYFLLKEGKTHQHE